MEQKESIVPKNGSKMAALTKESQAIVQGILEHLALIDYIVNEVMEKKVHYGPAFETEAGPGPLMLKKAGADQLKGAFNLTSDIVNDPKPSFDADGHLTVFSNCKIFDKNGQKLGESTAIASTREKKYAREKTSEVTSDFVPKEYWNEKKKLAKDDAQGKQALRKKYLKGGTVKKGEDGFWYIARQTMVEVNPPDKWNTVMKIADKRSFVSAIIQALRISNKFVPEHPESDWNEEREVQATKPTNSDEPPPEAYEDREPAKAPEKASEKEKPAATTAKKPPTFIK